MDADALQSLVEGVQPNSIVAIELDGDVCEATVKGMEIKCLPSVVLFANSKPVDSVDAPEVTELVNKVKQAGFFLNFQTKNCSNCVY